MGRETNRQRRERQAASARQKAAASRAAQHRVDQRRRAMSVLATVVTLAVVGAVIAVIAIRSNSTQSDSRSVASSGVLGSVTSVTPAALDAVAGGSATQYAKATSGDAPLVAPGTHGSNGKPELLFIGGEFCPYCAAERWSLVQALSRFGRFSNLSQIRSATTDGNIATFTFYKSSYTSKYLSFRPLEVEDRDQKSLETPSKAEEKLWIKYSGNPPGFPFLDFGGKYYQTAAGYSFNDLSGLTWQQIADGLKTPTSKVAQDILGESNDLTATICKMTNNQPTSVCLNPTITNLQSEIGA